MKVIRPHVDALVADGLVERVEVDDGGPPVVVPAGAELDGAPAAPVLLCPFDNLMWDRPFVRRAFGFDHLIEVYKKEHERAYGYYVLPLLVGDRFVGRADLKADRARGVAPDQALHARSPGSAGASTSRSSAPPRGSPARSGSPASNAPRRFPDDGRHPVRGRRRATDRCHGHTAGRGSPALLLHGGPGLPDYLEGCAAELANLFTTIRYTQRGVAPSTVGPPYTVETHMADALAVLDAFELEQAWVIGHSWGGHLALHLAVAHPERFHGIVCIDTLGASPDPLPEFAREPATGALRRRARAGRRDRRARRGREATEEEILERRAILWPHYFFDPGDAPRARSRTRRPRSASSRRAVDRGALRARHPGERPAQGPDAGALRPRHRPTRCRSAARSTPPSSSARRRVARIPRAGHYPVARAARLPEPHAARPLRPALTASEAGPG